MKNIVSPTHIELESLKFYIKPALIQTTENCVFVNCSVVALSNLEYLDFSGNEFGRQIEGVLTTTTAWSAVIRLQKLKTLILADCKITEIPYRYVHLNKINNNITTQKFLVRSRFM